MPFIAPKRRDEIKAEGFSACKDVGDLCFVFYSQIMQIWRTEPRWRTVHRIYRMFFLSPIAEPFVKMVYDEVKDKFEWIDIVAASHLAYKVFFSKYVMKYEDEKESSNGTI